MRVLMTEDSNNAVSSSFLLDDDSRFTFYLSFSTMWFSFSLFLAISTQIFVPVAAFHFQWMICPSQWNKLTSQTLNHHLLFVRIQDLVSCCHGLIKHARVIFISLLIKQEKTKRFRVTEQVLQLWICPYGVLFITDFSLH